MKLDITTVAAVSGLIVTLCGVTFILNTTLRRNDRVGRIWSVGFVGGILETLAYTIEGLQSSAWWAIAVGNGAFVLALGMLWSGARAANERRSLYAIPLVTGMLVTVAVLARGPQGGLWAGGAETFGSTAVFGAGTLVAAAFAFGAWRVVGEAKKLPEARGSEGERAG